MSVTTGKVATKQEDEQPRYRVGTRFLRAVPGWGMCEGIVASYDGENYTVDYPSTTIEGDIVTTKMLDGATVITNWDCHLLTDNQNVWVRQGKGQHPAIILSIASDDKAIVRYTVSGAVLPVDLQSVFPMFDDNDETGESKVSSFSKRKRSRTNRFIDGRDQPVAALLGQKPQAKKFKEEQLDRIKNENVDHCEKPISIGQEKINDPKQSTMKPKGSKRPATKRQKKKQSSKSTSQYNKISDKDDSPGPGWEFEHGFWVSPVLELEFNLVNACKFEAFRVELDGDEQKAYQKFSTYFGESKQKKICTMSCLSKIRSVKDESEVDNGLGPENEKYNMLWDYYMNQKVRKDEEIPGGMVLRRKVAQCSLLRSKSKFRRLVHKKIVALNEANERANINQILEQLYEHDISGQCGDGPINLRKEILGEQAFKHDDDVVEVVTCELKSSPIILNIEESSASMSSLTDSLPRSPFANTPNRSSENPVNNALWNDNEPVDLRDKDENVAEMSSSVGGGKSDLHNIDSNGMCNTPTSDTLFKGWSHNDVIDLMDDDSDVAYSAPTPLKRVYQKAELCVIDLIEDDPKVTAPDVSKEAPSAIAQEIKESIEIIEIE